MPIARTGGGASPRVPPIALLALVTAIAPAALHMLVPAFPLLALLVARHIESERFLRSATILVTGLYLAVGLFAAP